MIFRGQSPEEAVWRRFRNGKDYFAFSLTPDGLYETRVSTTAERAVDLLYTLGEYLAPAIKIVVSDKRNGTIWVGESVPLPDIRDAIARLKVPLSTSGGVEISLFTDTDQLTLTAGLELYVYAVSDRWQFLLQGIGLELADERFVGRNQPWDTGAAETLTEVLKNTVERLSLKAQ